MPLQSLTHLLFYEFFSLFCIGKKTLAGSQLFPVSGNKVVKLIAKKVRHYFSDRSKSVNTTKFSRYFEYSQVFGQIKALWFPEVKRIKDLIREISLVQEFLSKSGLQR